MVLMNWDGPLTLSSSLSALLFLGDRLNTGTDTGMEWATPLAIWASSPNPSSRNESGGGERRGEVTALCTGANSVISPSEGVAKEAALDQSVACVTV